MLNFHRRFSKILLKFLIHEQLHIFTGQVSVVASVGVNKVKETIQVKNKNNLFQKLTTCVLLLRKKQKEISREMFLASQVWRLLELIQSE